MNLLSIEFAERLNFKKVIRVKHHQIKFLVKIKLIFFLLRHEEIFKKYFLKIRFKNDV